MFWRFNFTSSNIVSLLEKEDVTLETILNEEDVLQECKARNTKLIEFLTKPEHIQTLVEFVINNPLGEENDKLKFKLPNISTEILTSDVNEITESLLNNFKVSSAPTQAPSEAGTCSTATVSPASPSLQTADAPLTTPVIPPTTPINPFKVPLDEATIKPSSSLDLLFSFFDQESINPLQASFVCKVVNFLINKKSSQILSYMKGTAFCLERILRHIDTSAVMDMLLKMLINMEVMVYRTECLKWLNDEDLMNKLIDLLQPQFSSDTHNNCSQLICDIIRYCREQIAFEKEQLNNIVNNEEDKEDDDDGAPSSLYHVLLNVIQSEAVVGRLLDTTLKPPLQQSLVLATLDILHTLLEMKKITETTDDCLVGLTDGMFSRKAIPDIDAFFIDTHDTLKAMLPRLHLLHHLLLEPPKQHFSPMNTTYGTLEQPFGPSRFKTTKLLICLLSLNHTSLSLQVHELGSLGVLLDHLHKYKWNNFLHKQFCHLLEAILSNALTNNSTFKTSGKVTDATCQEFNDKHNVENDVAEKNGDMEDENKMDVTNEASISHDDLPANAYTDSSTKLLSQLLIDFHLLERVMDVLQNHPDDKIRLCNHGYTGHMTQVANHLCSPKHHHIIQHIISQPEFPEVTRHKWQSFKEGTLVKINTLNTPSNINNNISPVQNESLSLNSINSTLQKYGINESSGKQEMDISEFIEDSIKMYSDNAALFESLCEERKGTEDDDEDNDGVIVKKDDEKDEDDDEVWDDKLANFPESLLKAEQLVMYKERENEQKLENICIKEGDVVMQNREEAKEQASKGDANKNVEAMDTSNGGWANFEEGNKMEEEPAWADFSQLEKEENNANNSNVETTNNLAESSATSAIANP